MDSIYFIDKLAILIRYYREASGLSQADIADKLHVGLRSYQRYESGESSPPIDLVFNIATLLKFKLEDLFPSSDLKRELNGLKLYQEAEYHEFHRHPLIKASDLMTFYQSGEYQELIQENDLKKARSSTHFMKSDYMLAIANPKFTIINPATMDYHGLITDIIPTTSMHDDRRLLADVWTSLIDRGDSYFDAVLSPYRSNSKKSTMYGKFVFSKNRSNYHILGVAVPFLI